MIRDADPEEGERTAEYTRLLDFLSTSSHYRPYRLLSRLADQGEWIHSAEAILMPSPEMPEARAILLGRLGNHDEALRIYVHRLKDYSAAEASVHFYFPIHSLITSIQLLRRGICQVTRSAWHLPLSATHLSPAKSCLQRSNSPRPSALPDREAWCPIRCDRSIVAPAASRHDGRRAVILHPNTPRRFRQEERTSGGEATRRCTETGC